jgi:hypothetical protein
MAKRQLIRAGIRRQDLARANGRRRQLLSLAKPSAGIRRRVLTTANGKMREISSLDNLRLVFVGGLYQKVVHSSELLPLPTGVLFADMLETVNNHSRQLAKFRRAILCTTARKTRFVKEGAHHATFRFCGTAIFAKRKC